MPVVCQVASVPQSPELFRAPLRCNIEYGLKGCTIERVKAAAVATNADAFISKLDDGYDAGTDGSHSSDSLPIHSFIDAFNCRELCDNLFIRSFL